MADRRRFWIWSGISTALCESVTLAVRFGTGVTATEFNATAPLILQIHHMFWSIPFFIVAALWRRKPFAPVCAGIGAGLVASDLLHHFLVLPLLVGNTGWHWP